MLDSNEKYDHVIHKFLNLIEESRRENVQCFLHRKKRQLDSFMQLEDLKSKRIKTKKRFTSRLQESLAELEIDEDTKSRQPIITLPSSSKYEELQRDNFKVQMDVQLNTEHKMESKMDMENKMDMQDKIDMENKMGIENKIDVGNMMDMENRMDMQDKIDLENKMCMENKMDMQDKLDMENKMSMENKMDMENKIDLENKLETDHKIDSEYELETFCAEFEKSLEKFIAEDALKTYRNELQLFIRTTINTISGNSVEEVKTKSKKMILLFTKSPISYKGKQIDCSQHPDALNFCMHFAAKTFISSGIVQVASVSAAAFPIGAVIALIWSRFPTFGKLFLGSLIQKCPYVKPSYSNNQLDNDESYSKRCRALLMVYGAVIQIKLSNKHPHGMRYGWMWLSIKLNQSPDPFMSSSILQAFLQIISFKMSVCYKGQFYKILYFIKNVYLPMISKIVGAEGNKQPFIKFELFIKESIDRLQKFGHLSQPPGYIDRVFM